MDKNRLSMIEIARDIADTHKNRMTFKELYDKVAEIKEFTTEEYQENIAQFYTDINSSGDFVYCGEDLWNLKRNEKTDALDSEFYSEHIGNDEEEEEKPKKVRRSTKKKPKFVEEMGDDEDSYDDFDDDPYDPYDHEEDDEDEDEYHSHEKDIDSELDDKDDDSSKDDDDDFDEDRYNEIMDEYEDKY